MKSLAALVLLCSSIALAEKLQEPLTIQRPRTHRVAVIGGGAAGASTAYHLHKFAGESQLDTTLQITLFEKETRIGGRTTTVNALNDTRYPTELGGSIFVRINQILYNLTQEFGLSTDARVFGDEATSDYDLGVWNGKEFVFKQSNSDSQWQGYWDIAKLLWKYGLAPVRTRNLARTVVDKFLRFYEKPHFPFASLGDVIEDNELLEYISVTGKDLLAAYNADGAFANDIVQASTRVNYAQNLDQIHGVEAMVCMSTEGGMSVDNGNWQIFHEAVRHSGAEAIMDTSIIRVRRNTSDSTASYILSTSDETDFGPFDAVVLAAPYQLADIEFDPPLKHVPESIDYVSLHVTLFTSPHLLSPDFFGLSPELQAEVPSTVLTTLATADNDDDLHDFFSISHLSTLYASDAAVAANANLSMPQNLYKIFSHKPLTGHFLSKLLDFDHKPTASKSDPISELPSWDISWQLEKVWHSYPYEIPRTKFERIKLEGDDRRDGTGIWYTSGIESFISTMETSALMGMNVAGLIVQELGVAH
jgi:prenylcysteine oxidase / farnesylcysteine lyase